MSIYSRKNLIINTTGQDSLLVQKMTNAKVLIWDAKLGSFEQYQPSAYSVTYIVADIAARDDLVSTITQGSLVYVTDTGEGESAIYMWVGGSFVVVSTEDSATTDARTLTTTVSYSSTSPIYLGRIGKGCKASSVIVEVTEAWSDTSAELTIGTLTNPETFMNSSINDLSNISTYLNIGEVECDPLHETEVYVFINNGSSISGQAKVSLVYI